MTNTEKAYEAMGIFWEMDYTPAWAIMKAYEKLDYENIRWNKDFNWGNLTDKQLEDFLKWLEDY